LKFEVYEVHSLQCYIFIALSFGMHKKTP
jgi:hypothetical protein